MDIHEFKAWWWIVLGIGGVLGWIFRLGGKVTSHELAYKTLSEDVDAIEKRVAITEQNHNDTRTTLARIDTNQAHIAKAIDNLVRLMEGK